MSCKYLKDNECSLFYPDLKDCKNCVFSSPETTTDVNVAIEGVGKDAPIEVNANGGKQSKSPMSMHLVDPEFLIHFFCGGNDTASLIITSIAQFMQTGNSKFLYNAIKEEQDYLDNIITIAKVLQEGARTYTPNNWRLIPQEEHINHALIHCIARLKGDTQDNHLAHALCRVMMAIATKPSEGFSYTEYKNEGYKNS